MRYPNAHARYVGIKGIRSHRLHKAHNQVITKVPNTIHLTSPYTMSYKKIVQPPNHKHPIITKTTNPLITT